MPAAGRLPQCRRRGHLAGAGGTGPPLAAQSDLPADPGDHYPAGVGLAQHPQQRGAGVAETSDSCAVQPARTNVSAIRMAAEITNFLFMFYLPYNVFH